MVNADKSYGYMVTKPSPESADITIKTKLQVLGDSTNATSLVSTLQALYIQHAVSYIKTIGSFEALSYQGRNGRIIKNCILPN